MAIMIPSIPQDFSPESREGEMFLSLQKLPDDYYVFHSFRIIKLEDNTWKENEIDFVIFNKDKGLLCLEAKAGDVYCERGIWHYGSGKEMRDPFAQANSNRWKLSKYMEEFYQTQEIKRHCKILSGVWFPGIDNNKLSRLALPSNAIKEAVLTGDDLDNPLDVIERIFSIQVPVKVYADCRLTLYKNCRNTKKIAETSFKPIGKTPKLFDYAIPGVLPEISFVSEEDVKERIDLTIKQANANGIKDIQILSCVPSGESMLESYLENDFYNYKGQKIPFTTCRKFKGLEADKIILVDVNKNSIMDNNKLFYVGSSRARFELSILATLSDSDCVESLQSLNSIVKKNNPQLTLSKVLGCKLI